jgi:threonine-phosphate decarboxylase
MNAKQDKFDTISGKREMNYAGPETISNVSEPIRVAHGGRVYDAARRWKISPTEVIDFSANINPIGPPRGVLDVIEAGLKPENLRAYPDMHTFVRALAYKHRLVPEEIFVGSGATSLMFAILRAILPKRVLVLEPAFGEYFRACNAVNGKVTSWLLTEADDFTPPFANMVRAIKERQFDLVILNSPHNPTGRLYSTESLLSLIDAAEAHNVAVMLDEAFVDYSPRASLLSLAATKTKMVVLRSLTKFYAMPGLRVGYGVCSAGLAANIRQQLDPWSVSTVALEAGCAALVEDEFGSESRSANEQIRQEFAEALGSVGLHVFPSVTNFLLAKLPRGSGAELAGWLESERILIRRCDSFRGLGDTYVRLAVRSSIENRRLVSLIETWLKRNER